MSGGRVYPRINVSRLSAKLALAATLSAGITAAASTAAWGQTVSGAVRSDSEIQKDIVSALAHSGALKGQSITAATVEGEVTISGNVRDEASKELAESLLSRVNGVRALTNNLTVGASASASLPAAAPVADSSANQDQNPSYDPAQQNVAPVAGDEVQAQSGPQQEQVPQEEQAPQQQTVPPASAQAQPGYPQQPYYSQQPVTLPAGTLLQVRTAEPLDAPRLQPGQVFSATVAADIFENNVLAIPRGAVISGKVVSTSSNKGDLAGKQAFSLALTSVNFGGHLYSLPTDTWSGQGPGKGGYSAANTIGGAGLGAVIGAIAGGGAGAAIGAGVGGIAGAGASAATTGPRLYVPAEAVLNFHLVAPVTVTPVSAQEAQRLASNAVPRPQQLRPRYRYPYGYPPPPPPYYYGYRYPVAYYPYYYYRY